MSCHTIQMCNEVWDIVLNIGSGNWVLSFMRDCVCFMKLSSKFSLQCLLTMINAISFYTNSKLRVLWNCIIFLFTRQIFRRTHFLHENWCQIYGVALAALSSEGRSAMVVVGCCVRSAVARFQGAFTGTTTLNFSLPTFSIYGVHWRATTTLRHCVTKFVSLIGAIEGHVARMWLSRTSKRHFTLVRHFSCRVVSWERICRVSRGIGGFRIVKNLSQLNHK